MPYPPVFLDWERADGISTNLIPVTVGTEFEPNDVRLVFITQWDSATTTTSAITAPTGWTKILDTGTGTFHYGVCLAKTLVAGDTDKSLSGFFHAPEYVAVTVRHMDLANSKFAFARALGGSGGTVAVGSVTTTGPGSDLVLFWNAGFFNMGTLPGYIPILWTDDSGPGYVSGAPVTASQALLQGKTIAASGATGTVSYGAAQIWWLGFRIAVRQYDDITVSVGVAVSEADTANAVTAVPQSLTTFQVGTAFESDSAFQVFTPLAGIRTSEPKLLSGDPVSTSRVTWDEQTYAPGSTVTVETSIDNGATFQVCTNNRPVPNLLPGSTSARTVISRVTITRKLVTDPTPRVRSLRVEISSDSARDELVPLGMFMLTETVITSTGGATSGGGSSGGGGDGVTGSGGGASGGGVHLELSGVDLSRVISRNPWPDVYFVRAGTNRGDAIMEMAEDRLPGVTFNFASTEYVVPKTLLFGTSQGSDPWQDMQGMATAIGFELFFDANGVLTFRPVPDPATSGSVLEINDSSNPVIASLTRTLTDETTYNCVVAMGESTGNAVPVQAVAIDDDPSSATYYLGDYGTRTMYYVSPMITTVEQAQAAADALLRIVKGVAETVELSIVPNPAIEPGDVITVNVADAKVAGTFLVNGTDIPLSAAEAMTLTLYRQG